MDSLPPFPQDSFVPYFMPVYPGAIIMTEEDVAAYEAFTAKYHDHFKPAGLVEEQLVQTLADSQWRLNRLSKPMRSDMWIVESPQTHAMQTTRKRQERIDLSHAANLYAMHQAENPPSKDPEAPTPQYVPAQDGFVLQIPKSSPTSFAKSA